MMRPKKTAYFISLIPCILFPLWKTILVDKEIMSFNALVVLMPLASILIFFTVILVLKIFHPNT